MGKFKSTAAMGLVISALLVAALPLAYAQKPKASGKPTAPSADEQAIRKAAADFAAAFNRHDARAVAQMWTPNGEYLDELGRRYDGRAAIEDEYAKFFKAHPKVKLRIAVDSVRLLNSTTAIEEGRVLLDPMPEGGPAISRYTAVDVKQPDGKWQAASVRDQRVAFAPGSGSLEDLAWLVGDWTAEHAGARVELSCDWNPEKSFLERKFTVTKEGKLASMSTEIIAWDPVAGEIRSWSFSSKGDRSEGVWHPRGKLWVVAHRGTLPDGTPTNSTDSWSHLLGDALGWRSVQRTVGGVPVADAREVVLKKAKAASASKAPVPSKPQ
jgi:uncharacterized protein (TIGR02246 family)